jgi:hypothetical protein
MIFRRLVRGFAIALMFPALVSCSKSGTNAATPTSPSSSQSVATSTPAEFVKSLCMAESTWLASFQTESAQMGRDTSSMAPSMAPEDLAKVQDVLVNDFEDMLATPISS